MGQTQHGPVCDVCGKYILPIFNEKVHTFRTSHFKGMMMADDVCAKIIMDGLDDWHKLPDGPMKNALLKDEAEVQ